MLAMGSPNAHFPRNSASLNSEETAPLSATALPFSGPGMSALVIV